VFYSDQNMDMFLRALSVANINDTINNNLPASIYVAATSSIYVVINSSPCTIWTRKYLCSFIRIWVSVCSLRLYRKLQSITG